MNSTKTTANTAGIRQADIMHWHLSGLLELAAQWHGDRPFLIGSRTLTYADALAETNQIAAWLSAHGVKRGDRVVITTANRLEIALVVFAAARLGAIFVVINNLIKAHGFRQIASQTEPKAIFFDESTQELAAEATGATVVQIGGGPALTGAHRFAELLATDASGLPPFPGVDLDPVCLVFTSGSTGTPRGVMLSHDNVRFATAAIQERLGYLPEDILGVFLPLSFDYGLYQIFLAAQAGTAIFVGRPEMIGPEILRTLATQKISVLPGVPTLFAAVLKMLERRPVDLPHLRSVTNTGDRLPQAYVDQLLKFFPKLRVYLMFGLTECKRVSILLPEQMAGKPGSVGRPLAGTEVYAIDREGKRLPPGEIGELVVRGRNVALGYWRAEEETRQRFRPTGPGQVRELYCGDSCVVDADGFIFFYGRNDHLLKHRGFRMSPLEVEEAACAIPGVSEAGLVKSDADDQLHLFVSLKDPALTPETIMGELLSRLEPVKTPEHLHIVTELPKTMNRKIDRKELKSLLPQFQSK